VEGVPPGKLHCQDVGFPVDRSEKDMHVLLQNVVDEAAKEGVGEEETTTAPACVRVALQPLAAVATRVAE
jgi:hypothetical protein